MTAAIRSRLLFALLIAASALLAPPALAQQRRSIVERYATWEEFEARRIAFAGNDIRVTDIETCVDAGQPWWVAGYSYQPNFQAPNGFDEVIRADSEQALRAQIDTIFASGWRADDIDASLLSAYVEEVGGGFSLTRENHRYAALLNPGEGAQAILSEASFAAFMAGVAARQGEGLRLVDLDSELCRASAAISASCALALGKSGSSKPIHGRILTPNARCWPVGDGGCATWPSPPEIMSASSIAAPASTPLMRSATGRVCWRAGFSSTTTAAAACG
ncbi:MAG: hypothetical protein R3C25_12245 [Hyphomonadaceae bacterium]